MTAKLIFVLTYGTNNAGVDIGNIRYNTKTANKTISNGDTLLIEGNFII